MPENFDPYRKWLGIPPDEQPPHHYRLLGIGPFESDADVIQEAADRQMAHVQTHKMGRYSDLSQKLLNELAGAKLTLLNADRKAAYDSALRAKLAAAKAATPRTAVPLGAALGPGGPPVAAQPVAGRPVMARAMPLQPPPIQPTRPATVSAATVVGIELEDDFTSSTTNHSSRRASGKHAGKKKLKPVRLAAGGVILVMIAIIVYLANGLRQNSDSVDPTTVATTTPNASVDPPKSPGDAGPHTQTPTADNGSPDKLPPEKVTKGGPDDPAPRQEQPDDPETTNDPPAAGANHVVQPAKVSPEMLGVLQGHPGAINCSAISPNGKRAVTAGREGGLQVWDVDRKQLLRQIPLQGEFANAVVFFGDNVRVATAGHDGYVRIVDTNTGNELQAWGGIKLPMMSVAVTPDGRLVVAGGHEKVVRVWEVATGKEANRWAGFKDHIYAVAITPDGRRILAASGGYWPSGKLTSAEDHTVHMVDLKTKQESKFSGHQGGIWSLSVSGNGQRAASASYDGTVRVWNLLSGTLHQTLETSKQPGAKPIVWSCAFSRDGRYVVSGGDDAVLRVWEAESGRLAKQLTGSTRSITCVSLSDDSRVALTSGSENLAREWAIRQPVHVAVKPEKVKPNEGGDTEAPSETTTDENPAGDPDHKTPATKDPAVPRVALADLFVERKLAGDPVPEQADRQQAIKLIKEIFQDDYKAAKKPPEKIALAEKLLDQATKSQSSTERYALMSEARDRAREAGNSALVIEIYEKMAGQFAIDPLDEMVKTFDQLQKDTSPPATKKELAENLLPLSERAVAAQKYETARKLLSIALAAARKTNDQQLPRQIVARDAEVGEQRKHYDAAKAAHATLATDPDNAAANLALGKYLCFDKDNWVDGLPLLAKGSGESLAQLAAKDAVNPAGFEEQVKLADAWYAAADSADAKEKPKFLARSEKWYQTALPNLPAGLTKTKVEKRLEELVALQPAARPSGTTKTPAEITVGERPATTTTPSTTSAATAKSFAMRMKQAIKKNALVFSQLVGGTTGNPYQEVPPAGTLLIGFNYTLNEYDYISSIQPLYQTTKGQVAGTAYGYVNGSPQTIVAKKGYAVSAVQVQGSYYMYGLQVDFMKVDKYVLDSKDTYSSEWVGRKYSGYRQVVLGGDGNPVVGVYGKTNTQQVASLGLIQLPPEK